MTKTIRKIKLSRAQLKRLADLFMHVSEASFLAAIALPAITSIVNYVLFARYFFSGLIFLWFALNIESRRDKLK